MNLNSTHKLHRTTLAIDLLSIILSFFLAIAIRYKAILRWVDYNSSIYVSLFITAILFQIIVYFVYDYRRATIVQMDVVDNALRLVKSRVFLFVLMLLYLYVTQKTVLASRIVISVFAALSVVSGVLFRMLLRKGFMKSRNGFEQTKTCVISIKDQDFTETLSDIDPENCDTVVVLADGTEKERVDVALKTLEEKGLRTYLSLRGNDYLVRPGIVTDVDGYATIPAFVRRDRFNLFGVNFCISRIEEAVHHVLCHLDQLKGEYICFSNVHTSVMARENADYADVLNQAALVFPDGNPIAELQRKKGYQGVERVAGPDFMTNMFRDTQDGSISHYFYGSSEKTLVALKENLIKKYPGISIKGMYSPPFRELTGEEDEEDVKRINESGADIVWVGLGAPKQEKWMNAHKGRIDAVMMGVGAGFDFHAGTIDRAPVWMQRIGLEWLFRLFKDPGRLFKRYFVTNIKFFWYLLQQKKN